MHEAGDRASAEDGRRDAREDALGYRATQNREASMTAQHNQAQEKPKLNIAQLVFAAWPMALVAVGGAVGGACGGLAWAINTKIMSSKMSAPMRYGLCVLTGIAAIGLWMLAVFALTLAFPGMFAGG